MDVKLLHLQAVTSRLVWSAYTQPLLVVSLSYATSSLLLPYSFVAAGAAAGAVPVVAAGP